MKRWEILKFLPLCRNKKVLTCIRKGFDIITGLLAKPDQTLFSKDTGRDASQTRYEMKVFFM